MRGGSLQKRIHWQQEERRVEDYAKPLVLYGEQRRENRRIYRGILSGAGRPVERADQTDDELYSGELCRKTDCFRNCICGVYL